MISPQAYRQVTGSLTAELRNARKKWRKSRKTAGMMRRMERERRIMAEGIEEIEEIPVTKGKTAERLFNPYWRLTTGLAPWGDKGHHLRPCWVFFGKEGAEFRGYTLQELVRATAVHGTKGDLYDLAYYITACGLTNAQLGKRFEYDEKQLLATGGGA